MHNRLVHVVSWRTGKVESMFRNVTWLVGILYSQNGAHCRLVPRIGNPARSGNEN